MRFAADEYLDEALEESTPVTKYVTLPAHLFEMWVEKWMEVSGFVENATADAHLRETDRLRALGALHEVIGGLRAAAASGVTR